jgi:glycosyltransferase involved in cell wall biosynthesis
MRTMDQSPAHLSLLPTATAIHLQTEAMAAAEAIGAGEYDIAQDLSAKLQDSIWSIDIDSLRSGAVGEVETSIIVVAHRPSPMHAELLSVLMQLDPRNVQVILVENAADPIFPASAMAAGAGVEILRMGFNAGIGIARNLAIRLARGARVVLLDDDGKTTPESIEALTSVLDQYDAAAVRGRVVPLTYGSAVPAHYDLGPTILTRVIDIEGMSVWRTSLLVEAQGFDPILYGHEGAELSVRLYPLVGPAAFLYCPTATLFHDYSTNESEYEAKVARYTRLVEYCETKHHFYRRRIRAIRAVSELTHGATALPMRHQFAAHAATKSGYEPVSILTTCHNGVAFVPEFVQSLARQSVQDFQLVFVDDGSTDGSADALQAALPQGLDVILEKTAHLGRGAALNRAVDLARHDLCLIADVDDLMVPQRVAWTGVAYDLFPQAKMIGFSIFDDLRAFRTARPIPMIPDDLHVRKIFGMPSPFPAFSFRKSAISARFDETLKGGIDCDWMFRALEEGVDGYLLPLSLTYYRLHDGQITTQHRPLQRSVALRHLRALHADLTGAVVDDVDGLEYFAGWRVIENREHYQKAFTYALRIIAAAYATGNPRYLPLIHQIEGLMQWMNGELLTQEYQELEAYATEVSTPPPPPPVPAPPPVTQSAEYIALQAEMARVTGYIDEVQRSTSWRVTAPLRAISRRLGRH